MNSLSEILYCERHGFVNCFTFAICRLRRQPAMHKTVPREVYRREGMQCVVAIFFYQVWQSRRDAEMPIFIALNA
jgi:type IV secretory pathway TrbD component